MIKHYPKGTGLAIMFTGAVLLALMVIFVFLSSPQIPA
jgi:hypothetical protein